MAKCGKKTVGKSTQSEVFLPSDTTLTRILAIPWMDITKRRFMSRSALL